MRLIFYSKWGISEAERIDLEFVNLLKDKKSQIGYVLFADKQQVYFKQFKDYYRRYGLRNFYCFNLEEVSPETTAILFRSRAIFLPGGNSYSFLYLLRKKRFFLLLRKYADKGGILVGMSAGAIIMTPNINLASIPRFNSDKNEVNLKNLKALGLVKFEFSPHFKENGAYIKEVLNYSKKTKNIVYACPDGSGIKIDNGKMVFINKIFRFQKGKLKEIN